MNNTSLYFAYGSNMLFSFFSGRISSVEKVSVALLEGYRIFFDKPGSKDGTGKCCIEKTGILEDVVYGVLYRISDEDLLSLDTSEGVGIGYERELITVTDSKNKSCEAYSYIPTIREASLKPYDWYKALVIAGAKENNFPTEYIKALDVVESIVDSNEERRKKFYSHIENS